MERVNELMACDCDYARLTKPLFSDINVDASDAASAGLDIESMRAAMFGCVREELLGKLEHPRDGHLSAGVKPPRLAAARTRNGDNSSMLAAPASLPPQGFETTNIKTEHLPPNRAEFARTMNAIDDPQERAAYYAKFAPALGFESGDSPVEGAPTCTADFMRQHAALASAGRHDDAARFYSQHAKSFGL